MSAKKVLIATLVFCFCLLAWIFLAEARNGDNLIADVGRIFQWSREELNEPELQSVVRNIHTVNSSAGAMLDVYNLSAASHDNHTCIKTRSIFPRFFICVHPFEEDRYVSKFIVMQGIYERGIVVAFQTCLAHNPEYGVIDLGANVGQYALLAAMMGRPVVAVEARYLHVEMIHHSVLLNDLQNKSFKLLHNAVSDNRHQMHLSLSDKRNQGHTEVRAEKMKRSGIPGSELATVRAIFMDDLLEVVTFKKAIIKIDIEGSEHKAIAHCEKLLQSIFVPYIFMEWDNETRNPEEGSAIIAILSKNGYVPHSLIFTELYISNVKYWPGDIIWKHKSV